jgi:hypothetical protein
LIQHILYARIEEIAIMGAGASVNEEFLDDTYRKRLEVTLQQEIERHGIAKDKAAEIVTKMISEGENISKEQQTVAAPVPAAAAAGAGTALAAATTESNKADEAKKANDDDKDRDKAVERKQSLRGFHVPVVKGGNMFVCAVDGTEAGDLAFDAVKCLMKKKDHVCMFHAYNEPTAETRVAMRPENIKERYANELLGMYGPKRYSFIWENRRGSDVKSIISKLSVMYAKLANGASPDFLVMGYTGSRGITKKSGATTAGSVSNFAMRNIHMPIIIIKNEIVPGPKSYVMAVDGTEVSATGLDILFTLIKPQDSLTIVHVTEVKIDKLGNSTIDNVTDQYEKELEDNAPTTNVTFKAILMADGKTVAELIQEQVEEIGPDFFALAPRANPDNMLTSLTEQMIVSVKSNIVLCKL